MQAILILFSGQREPKLFNDLLTAMEYVVENNKQDNFMIKQSPEETWEDGAELFNELKKLFEPA